MKDLPIDQMLAALDSPQTGSNALNITDMLTSANKMLGQATMIMDKLEKMGLKPLIVRGAGAKLGVDAESPLKTDNAVYPATEAHKGLFSQLNQLTEQQVGDFIDALSKHQSTADTSLECDPKND